MLAISQSIRVIVLIILVCFPLLLLSVLSRLTWLSWDDAVGLAEISKNVIALINRLLPIITLMTGLSEK